MKTLLVGYDLNTPGKDYAKLIERLKTFPTWWHYLDSTWLIRSDQTAVQVRDDLKRLIDTNDELLVIDVSGDVAAWAGFSDRAGQWIKDNI